MTLKELHERIGWQLEGRLQSQDSDGRWYDWSLKTPPSITLNACVLRRRPDAPPIPDQVWITYYNGVPSATLRRFSDTSICYVRADRIIDGSRLEMRHKGYTDWDAILGGSAVEYRFKHEN